MAMTGRRNMTTTKTRRTMKTVKTIATSSNGHSPPRIPHCSLSPVNAHWWIIEPQDGKTSVGRCCYCKEQREFLNWLGVEFNQQ